MQNSDFPRPRQDAICAGVAYLMKRGRSPRVLIAEDDEATRTMLRTLLARRGYDVATAADGLSLRETLASASPDCPIDLIVSDVRMPGLSCDALLGLLREAPVPVVLMTAWPDLALRRSAIAMRASLLEKPFRADALDAVLAGAFAIR